MVDAFVVGISFALDVAIVIIQIDSTIMQGLALIIILRLWRLVRIVNGKLGQRPSHFVGCVMCVCNIL